MAEQDNALVIYIVDTSSWLAIEGHTAENRILSALVPLLEKGRIRFPPEVLAEMEVTSRLFSWLSPYKDKVIDNRRSDIDYLAIAGRIAHDIQPCAEREVGKTRPTLGLLQLRFTEGKIQANAL
jgi:hypothetical protein